MKNLMKAFGMALIVSGLFAVTNVSAQTTPAAAPAKTTTSKTTTPPAKTADKIVGKDAKGQNIYEGPKGGRYTIDAKGAKHYLPKATTATTPAKSTTAPKQ